MREPDIDKLACRAAAVFAVVNAVAYAGWLAMDISATFFGVAPSWVGPDVVSYVASLPLYPHLLVYGAAILAWVMAVLTVMRHRMVLAVCGAGALVATLDWVQTTMTPRASVGLSDQLAYVHVMIYGSTICLIILMWQRRLLR